MAKPLSVVLERLGQSDKIPTDWKGKRNHRGSITPIFKQGKQNGFYGWTTQWIRDWLDGHTCGQWLNVQVESSDLWHSGVGGGTGTVECL